MRWLLLKFFNLLYHSFAWSYDLVAWVVSGGRWKDWVRSIIPLISSEWVLELGSGTGVLQLALIESGCNIAALDESSQMLRIVKKKVVRKQLSQSARLIRGKAESMPFSSGFAGTIAATFPSEYINHVDTIRECRRVLKPGGRLVVLLGVEIGGKGIYDLFLRSLYAITLQKTPPISVLEKTLDRMASYGFRARIETIEFRHDRLTVLVAE